MTPRLRPASASLVALVAIVLAAATAQHARANGAVRDTPAGPAGTAGPRAHDAPSDAVVVTTFDALEKLVNDPNGPRQIWMREGSYRGDLVIKRPVAIRGAMGATLEGTGRTTILTIDSNDVTIENLFLRHSGRHSTTEDAGVKATGERIRISDLRIDDTLFGVSFQGCHHCALERVHVQGDAGDEELRGDGIKLWESHDSQVRGCIVDRMRDVVVWYTRRALLEGNVVRHSRYGTHFMYAHDGVARNNRIEDNVVGIFVMYSLRLTLESNVLAGAHGAAGMGVGFKESDAVQVRGNWLVANTTGAYLDYSPRTPADPVVFEGNVFALNDTALRLHGVEKGLAFHGNDFRESSVTVEVDGGGDALASDVRGNHFSDYEGYDLDGDGVGDVPFHVNALSSELESVHPTLRFFRGTAAVQLIDAVAHAVPVLESRTLLTDAAPLMRSPEVRLP